MPDAIPYIFNSWHMRACVCVMIAARLHQRWRWDDALVVTVLVTTVSYRRFMWLLGVCMAITFWPNAFVNESECWCALVNGHMSAPTKPFFDLIKINMFHIMRLCPTGNNLYMCIKLWAKFFFQPRPLFYMYGRTLTYKYTHACVMHVYVSLHTNVYVNEYVCNWCHCWYFESRPWDKHISAVCCPLNFWSRFFVCSFMWIRECRPLMLKVLLKNWLIRNRVVEPQKFSTKHKLSVLINLLR